LAVGHATVIQDLVKALDGGAPITDVILSALAVRTTHAFVSPCEASILVVYLGDLESLPFGHLRDGRVLAVTEALHEAMVSIRIE
jgi:hypothetical protein